MSSQDELRKRKANKYNKGGSYEYLVVKKTKVEKKKPIKSIYEHKYGGPTKGDKSSTTPEYKEGFPLTGDKPPTYSFDVYDKAVQRDSTQLSSWWGTLTARPGIENVLQVNREYREKLSKKKNK